MKIKTRILFLPLLILSLTSAVFSQEDPLDKVKWVFSVEQNGCEATIIAKVSIVDHWHVYAAHLPEGSFTLPTVINLSESSHFKLNGKLTEPKPEIQHDNILDDDLYLHSGVIELKQKIIISSAKDFTLKGSFSFQTCDDEHCLPPYDGTFELKINGCGTNPENTTTVSIEDSFVSINDDEAIDKNGANYVKVNGEWYKVPEGNSLSFYKKYLLLGGDHE